MWHLKTTAVLAIVGARGMIKKGTNEHFGKIPGRPSQQKIQKKVYFAELLITSEEYYQFDKKNVTQKGWRIRRLHLCRGIRSPHNEFPWYDTKQSDGEVPVILELWGMWSIPLLPLLPGPLWPGVVAPVKGPIYG